MAAKAFSYEFTGKEFFCFLFKRKKCPKCGGEMKQNKCSEIVDGSIYYHNCRADSLYLKHSEVKRYFYMYSCDECGSEYELSELAK